MANPTQIEILLSNLLSNAVRHATPKAVIQVHVNNDSIQVSNSGVPLRNPSKIFDRFQRDVTESSGSGLGLALVSKICDVNGYKIDYSYREGVHFFRVNFN
jgi:signal transduction histidine kinase